MASLQAGVPCGEKQLPELPDPQSWQSRLAASTHTASHAAVQQLGSMLQTVAQQTGSEQPGVGCALRHDPIAPGGHCACAGCGAASSDPTSAPISGNQVAGRIEAVSRIGSHSPSGM